MTEEMHHVLHYMNWHSRYWQSPVFKCEVLDTTVTEGIVAYAKKQAGIIETMAHHFSKKWLLMLKS